jgi:hypothetical protein
VVFQKRVGAPSHGLLERLWDFGYTGGDRPGIDPDENRETQKVLCLANQSP